MSNVFCSLLFYRKPVTELLRIPGFQQFSKVSLQKFPILFPSICQAVFLFSFFAVAARINLVVISLHEQDCAEVINQTNEPAKESTESKSIKKI